MGMNRMPKATPLEDVNDAQGYEQVHTWSQDKNIQRYDNQKMRENER